MSNIDRIKDAISSSDIEPSKIPNYGHKGDVTLFSEEKGFNEINPGGIVAEGDYVGYGAKGNMFVLKQVPELLEDDSQFDAFPFYTDNALNFEVSGYLDCGSYPGHSESVTGEDLYHLAKNNLEDEPSLRIESDEAYGVIKRVYKG